MEKKEKIKRMISYLKKEFPQDKIELDYETPFQLLVAVIMSAQTTDKQVNKTNKQFFQVLKEPSDVQVLGVEKITQYISTIGFYKNKAKYIYQTGMILQEKFHSQIPQSLEELTTLPGVGIKTAKVVLSHLYNQLYVAVDTHIHRITNRIGLVHTKKPEQTDKKLELLFLQEEIMFLHHRMVLFGRYKCKAIKPDCPNCGLKEICEYYKLKVEGKEKTVKL